MIFKDSSMLTDGPWLYTCLTFCGRFAAHKKPRPTYTVATAAVVGLAVSLKGALTKISLADGNADLAVRNQKSEIEL